MLRRWPSLLSADVDAFERIAKCDDSGAGSALSKPTLNEEALDICVASIAMRLRQLNKQRYSFKCFLKRALPILLALWPKHAHTQRRDRYRAVSLGEEAVLLERRES